MLRRLQHDAELAACWERWQVCGDVLRGRGHALLPADFSQRVAAAIAAPADAGRAAAAERVAHAGRDEARPRHRLLRWGGGALAASVALVAVFMARQVPEVQPRLVEAAGTTRPAEAVMDAPRQVAAIDSAAALAGVDTNTDHPADVPAVARPGSTVGAAALLAGAAPGAIGAADARRRPGERGSTRSQAQRAALRRNQGVESAPVAVAAGSRALPTPTTSVAATAPAFAAMTDAADALPALAGLAAGGAPEGEALFGGPAAVARPWPRAVLPGLSRRQPYAAGYGLPQADAFAPFHPRVDDRRHVPGQRMDGPVPQDAAAAPSADVPRPPGAR